MRKIVQEGYLKHFFRNFIKDKKVLLITHYDADGIISASLIAFLLEKFAKSYSIITFQSLEDLDELVKVFKYNNFDNFIFTDIGLSSLDNLFKAVKISGSKIKYCIIDHHTDDKTPFYKNKDNSCLIGYSKTQRGDYIISQTVDDNVISAGGICALLLLALDDILLFLDKKQRKKIALLGMVSCFSDVIISKENNEWTLPLYNEIKDIFFKDLAVFGHTQRKIQHLLGQLDVDNVYLPKSILVKNYFNLDDNDKFLLHNLLAEKIDNYYDEFFGLCCYVKICEDIYEIRELGSFINSLGRQNQNALAIEFLKAYLNGDEYCSIYHKCKKVHSQHKQDIRNAIIKSKGEINILDDILVYHSSASDKIVGSVLGVLMNNYKCKYAIGYAEDEDGKYKISCRSVDETIDIPKIMISRGIDIRGHATACGGKCDKKDICKIVCTFIEEVNKHKSKNKN